MSQNPLAMLRHLQIFHAHFRRSTAGRSLRERGFRKDIKTKRLRSEILAFCVTELFFLTVVCNHHFQHCVYLVPLDFIRIRSWPELLAQSFGRFFQYHNCRLHHSQFANEIVESLRSLLRGHEEIPDMYAVRKK